MNVCVCMCVCVCVCTYINIQANGGRDAVSRGRALDCAVCPQAPYDLRRGVYVCVCVCVCVCVK